MRRRLVWVLAGFAVSALFLWLAFRDADLGDVWATLKEGHVGLLLVAALVNFAGLAAKSLRWQILIRQRVPAFSFGGAFATTLLQAAGNNVLPARAGEVLRPMALQRFGGGRAAEGLGAGAVDRVFDGLALLTLSVAALPWAGYRNVVNLEILAIGVVGILLFLWLRTYSIRRAPGQVPRLFRRWRPRAQDAVARFFDGLAILGRPRLEATLFAISLLSWAVQGLLLMLVAQAYDLELTTLETLVVLVLLNLAIMLPSAPGSAGTFEFGAASGFALFGADASTAGAVALAYHAVQWFPVTLAGATVALLLLRTPRTVPLETAPATPQTEKH